MLGRGFIIQWLTWRIYEHFLFMITLLLHDSSKRVFFHQVDKWKPRLVRSLSLFRHPLSLPSPYLNSSQPWAPVSINTTEMKLIGKNKFRRPRTLYMLVRLHIAWQRRKNCQINVWTCSPFLNLVFFSPTSIHSNRKEMSGLRTVQSPDGIPEQLHTGREAFWDRLHVLVPTWLPSDWSIIHQLHQKRHLDWPISCHLRNYVEETLKYWHWTMEQGYEDVCLWCIPLSLDSISTRMNFYSRCLSSIIVGLWSR